MLHEHRVLTSGQIARLAFGSPRVANKRLAQLYGWRAVDRFQPFRATGAAPMHYVLDIAGAAAIAAERDQTPAGIGYRHDRAIAIAHSLHLAHTVSANAFFVDLAAPTTPPGAVNAGADPDGVLTTWWSETRCGRYFGDHVRPDGYGHWQTHDRSITFFLENDCGTETLGRVAAKLRHYDALADATTITSAVLFWFSTAARETAARDAMRPVHRALTLPAAVPVATTAADLPGAGTSRAGPRWRPLGPDRRAETGGRLPLAALPGSAARQRLRAVREPADRAIDDAPPPAPPTPAAPRSTPVGGC